MSKATLQEITDQLLGMLLEIDESDGEVDDEIGEKLEQAEADFEDKVERIASVIQSFEATAAAEKARAAKVLEHSKSLLKKADQLKAWTLDNLQRLGQSTVKAGRYKVTIRKKPTSVGLSDDFVEKQQQTRMDIRYGTLNYKNVATPDKKAIKEHLLAGGKLEGAWLEEDNKRLEIK